MPLTPEVEAELLAHMSEKTFRRGELIEQRSEMNNFVYFIVSGMARVFFYKGGRDHTTSFAMDGEFILINHALMANSDAVMSIEFLERSKVIYTPHFSLRSSLIRDGNHVNEATPFIMAGMLAHMRDLEERAIVLQNHSARQRYRWMESRYPRIVERASIPQIASFLGLTKETLYRIRSNKYSAK